MILMGSGPVLIRDPIFLKFKGEGSGPSAPPPLDPHMSLVCLDKYIPDPR